MPRGQKSVTTTFQKAKPKRKVGRPRGSKTTTFNRTPRAEINHEREEFLNEHRDIPFLKALEIFQKECDCSLNPWRLLAIMPTTLGYRLWSCQNCLKLHRENT
jgi:hypothetical protein